VVSHGADVRLLVALPAAARTAIVRRIARRADAWRFVSAPLLAALASRLGARDAATLSGIAKVQACAIDLPDVSRDAARLRADARPSGPLYVVVGRLVASKRIDAAIDHVARTAPGAHLVVVGDGPLRADLEKLAASRGVDARFFGTLPRRQALAWIGAADALIHASRVEGLSTVVREANALGVPIVRA
jgi:glycosyltransferase involved in cell wall biosynthesis